jgi:hypothetical protein
LTLAADDLVVHLHGVASTSVGLKDILIETTIYRCFLDSVSRTRAGLIDRLGLVRRCAGP